MTSKNADDNTDIDILPLEMLIEGQWYVGVGRYTVALWGNDGVFHTTGKKFGRYLVFEMEYGSKGFEPMYPI